MEIYTLFDNSDQPPVRFFWNCLPEPLKKVKIRWNVQQREIQEETGFAARKFTSLGAVWLAPGYSTEYLHFFLATDLYPSRKQGDEDEFISVDVIPYVKALEMARSGLIKDGKSLAGLFLIGDKMQE